MRSKPRYIHGTYEKLKTMYLPGCPAFKHVPRSLMLLQFLLRLVVLSEVRPTAVQHE
jgi:hypothetical protein